MTRRALLLMMLAGILALSGFGFSALPMPTAGWMDYTLVRTAFTWYLHQDAAEIEKESRSGHSDVYYFTSYYLNGILSAAEATGSESILNKALQPMDNMMATVQTIEYKGQHFQAWGPFLISPHSDVPHPNVHHTLQAAVPLARAAALIMANPRWKAKHGEQAKRYIAFVDSAVMKYWYLSQFKRAVPWLDTEHVPIWNDNATNMGLVGTYLYRATGDPMAREVALAVGQAFKRKLAQTGRAWIWESYTIPIGSDTDNTPGSVGNQAGVPDTSHTNREPFLMISLYETGLLFTREDIERMAYTFLDNIWNQSYEDPSFANYMNGSNRPYRVYKDPGLNGPIYHGWALVGGYSKEAQDVLVAALKAIMKGDMVHGKTTNPSLVRNSTSYGGKVGLTGHLLRNYAVFRRQSQRAPVIPTPTPLSPPVDQPSHPAVH